MPVAYIAFPQRQPAVCTQNSYIAYNLMAGHAGFDVAIYSSKFLHKNVVDSAAYKVRFSRSVDTFKRVSPRNGG
jgi:hypothetical protein